MSNLVLNLAIDVSGTPKGDVYVGLVSIKTDQINNFEKSFKREFPNLYYRRKYKGSKIKETELKRVIEFLDKNYIFMYANYVSKSDWHYFMNQYPNKSNPIERVYSLAYFGLIHGFVYKYYP